LSRRQHSSKLANEVQGCPLARHFSLNARHEAENACIRRIRVVEAERVGKVGYSLSPDLGLILTRSKIESIGGFLAMMVLLWKFRP
jgi:hypothetical protein